MNETLNQTGETAVEDSVSALNDSAIESIERMTTDAAQNVANFLYARDTDILYVASLAQNDEVYSNYINHMTGKLIDSSNVSWVLGRNEKGESIWVAENLNKESNDIDSTNPENNDRDGFHYRTPDEPLYISVPLYDEITYIDTTGQELYKAVASCSTKVNYPLDPAKRNVSNIGTYGTYLNTYVKSESYWPELLKLKEGEIYVSDVIGAYIGSNYIGMYTPEIVAAAAESRGYEIEYDKFAQAYSGMENPFGQRFEGIVRWATPVVDKLGAITGYVTLALNHDHIMEFVDHITPSTDRYTELPNAYEGNYAFIWDYNCRSIAHPRHHSIVGFDPDTGLAEIPWLETSIYLGWQEALANNPNLDWITYVNDYNIKTFDEQSRNKIPAPALTQAGLVGLDGRYLNNAPQCTGWMDLTQNGGSGSFYILWSGLYKLTTAAAIPYYTGQYSEEASGTRRGFGFVAIGAGLEDFTRPAMETETKLNEMIGDANDKLTSSTEETHELLVSNLTDTTTQLIITTIIIIALMILIAVWLSSSLTGNLTRLNKGIARFKAGERQFRFNTNRHDEFGEIAVAFDDMADSIVASVKNLLSITDKNYNIVYMNEVGLQYSGKTLDDVVGKPYSEYGIYPYKSKYCPFTALEEQREADVYYHKLTGRYLKGAAAYLLDKQGNNVGYVVESSDITDMINEKKEIEAQRKLLATIFSSSPDLIWYQDVTGRYITVNPRFASISNKSTEEFEGKFPLDVLPHDIAIMFIERDSQVINSGKPIFSEEKIVFYDGHTEILDSVRTPIYDNITGEITSVLGFARNITTRVEVEEELRFTQLNLERAVESANIANSHKGEFLARMSHEIRTPMNAIICITDILQRKISSLRVDANELGDIKVDLGHIEVSSKHLLSLLNDILDISKIDAGKIDIILEPIELSKLVEIVSEIIRPRCNAKNISFNVVMDTFNPSTFMMDDLRLRQVLINLLGNAVKFTPELGTVTFVIQNVFRDEANSKTLVKFLVEDTGIGIASDKLDSVFRSFEQGDASITQRYGGTGLGLAISQKIVKLFGGEIIVESVLGEGSKFSFEIALSESETAPESNVRTLDDAIGKFIGKRALVVDDVEINRMILVSLLEPTGMILDEASDGLVALEKFKAAKLFEYDIIFMDIQMPNLDGYKASAAIRSLEREDAKTTPIVALTANAFKDDIDKALNNGMNSHIAKPIEEVKLAETLFKFLDSTPDEAKY
jgi:PAS domain S-box-containing protein